MLFLKNFNAMRKTKQEYLWIFSDSAICYIVFKMH